MFGLMFYAIGCFFLAGILTFISTMFRPIQDKGESRPWRAFFVWMVLCMGTPYIYSEILTRSLGPKMDKSIRYAYDSLDITGPMQYYRVIWTTGNSAKVIVVGLEKQSWGGKDRPLAAFNMIKEGEKWKVQNYRLVYSDRLNKDGISFPPYW
ncbi:MAG: hypothetical protein BGO01_03920 [Armatimonadetes bacterium 55-13]|nr:hypothetical protein [Armatimonadota bacterium]OJU63297.1 MAG: hypothetical protein BGO01_03920 [Armatimonadetes bacterium 55-13]